MRPLRPAYSRPKLISHHYSLSKLPASNTRGILLNLVINLSLIHNLCTCLANQSNTALILRDDPNKSLPISIGGDQGENTTTNNESPGDHSTISNNSTFAAYTTPEKPLREEPVASSSSGAESKSATIDDKSYKSDMRSDHPTTKVPYNHRMDAIEVPTTTTGCYSETTTLKRDQQSQLPTEAEDKTILSSCNSSSSMSNMSMVPSTILDSTHETRPLLDSSENLEAVQSFFRPSLKTSRRYVQAPSAVPVRAATTRWAFTLPSLQRWSSAVDSNGSKANEGETSLRRRPISTIVSRLRPPNRNLHLTTPAPDSAQTAETAKTSLIQFDDDASLEDPIVNAELDPTGILGDGADFDPGRKTDSRLLERAQKALVENLALHNKLLSLLEQAKQLGSTNQTNSNSTASVVTPIHEPSTNDGESYANPYRPPIALDQTPEHMRGLLPKNTVKHIRFGHIQPKLPYSIPGTFPVASPFLNAHTIDDSRRQGQRKSLQQSTGVAKTGGGRVQQQQVPHPQLLSGDGLPVTGTEWLQLTTGLDIGAESQRLPNPRSTQALKRPGNNYIGGHLHSGPKTTRLSGDSSSLGGGKVNAALSPAGHATRSGDWIPSAANTIRAANGRDHETTSQMINKYEPVTTWDGQRQRNKQVTVPDNRQFYDPNGRLINSGAADLGGAVESAPNKGNNNRWPQTDYDSSASNGEMVPENLLSDLQFTKLVPSDTNNGSAVADEEDGGGSSSSDDDDDNSSSSLPQNDSLNNINNNNGHGNRAQNHIVGNRGGTKWSTRSNGILDATPFATNGGVTESHLLSSLDVDPKIIGNTANRQTIYHYGPEPPSSFPSSSSSINSNGLHPHRARGAAAKKRQPIRDIDSNPENYQSEDANQAAASYYYNNNHHKYIAAQVLPVLARAKAAAPVSPTTAVVAHAPFAADQLQQHQVWPNVDLYEAPRPTQLTYPLHYHHDYNYNQQQQPLVRHPYREPANQITDSGSRYHRRRPRVPVKTVAAKRPTKSAHQHSQLLDVLETAASHPHSHQVVHIHTTNKDKKSVGKYLLPIVIAAITLLIAFLIISNLLLSIPLLAIGAAALFNGVGPFQGGIGTHSQQLIPVYNISQLMRPTGRRRRRRKRKADSSDDDNEGDYGDEADYASGVAVRPQIIGEISVGADVGDAVDDYGALDLILKFGRYLRRAIDEHSINYWINNADQDDKFFEAAPATAAKGRHNKTHRLARRRRQSADQATAELSAAAEQVMGPAVRSLVARGSRLFAGWQRHWQVLKAAYCYPQRRLNVLPFGVSATGKASASSTTTTTAT